MRLQLRACAVDLVAHAFAMKAHDDGACPRAAVLVDAMSQAVAALEVVKLQRRRHSQLAVRDLLCICILPVVGFRDTLKPQVRPSRVLFQRVVGIGQIAHFSFEADDLGVFVFFNETRKQCLF